MKKNLSMVVFAVAAAFSLSAAPALAQDVVRGEDRTVYQKSTVLDFRDVTLEGELAKPEGQYGLTRGRTHFDSLIQLRSHFQQELDKSVEQL